MYAVTPNAAHGRRVGMATLAVCVFDEIVRDNAPRAAVLEQLIAQLDGFSSEDDRETFVHVFKDAKAILELSDLELAKLLRVSRPTIGRWERGESAPSQLARRPVFMALARIARSKLKVHNGG
jgi:DNA-binding XRE family transcriptional regulator